MELFPRENWLKGLKRIGAGNLTNEEGIIT